MSLALRFSPDTLNRSHLRFFQTPNPILHRASLESLRSSNGSPPYFAILAASSPDDTEPEIKHRRRSRRRRPSSTPPDDVIPSTRPRKPRRGRRSEAVAVEDFVVRDIRKHNSGVLEGKDEVLKERVEEVDGEEGRNETEDVGNGVVVEEEDADWPLDAEVGRGIRASEYFDKHPIRNVVVDGVEIDWEGEVEEGWVKEINCLEWESFAFHPSPLIVLVFERFKRAADNWRVLKELENAAKVYWSAKDHLPPRTIKVDINIETDLAYALKVRECPQLLFLKGNKILYREKEFRSCDELVQMIAHFYYNAKKPSWVDASAVTSPY